MDVNKLNKETLNEESVYNRNKFFISKQMGLHLYNCRYSCRAYEQERGGGGGGSQAAVYGCLVDLHKLK